MEPILKMVLDNLEETNENIVCILSGGLDSTILTYLLVKKFGNKKIFPIIFNYNQRHSFEIEQAVITCDKLDLNYRVINIDFFGDLVSKVSALSNKKEIDMPNIRQVLGDPQPVTYVPFRNMLFITLALSYAESNDCNQVYIGLQAHDLYQYWDTSLEFVYRMNEVTRLNRKHEITIYAPFANFSKKDEILLGQQLNVPFEDTWTCYEGPNKNEEACGICPSCAERIKNFMDAKIKDPIKYSRKINWPAGCKTL